MTTTTKTKIGRPKKKVEKIDLTYTITLNFNGKIISYPTDNPYDLFTWITDTLKTKLIITIEKKIGNLVQRKQKQLFIKEVRMIRGNKLRTQIFINRFLKELL